MSMNASCRTIFHWTKDSVSRTTIFCATTARFLRGKIFRRLRLLPLRWLDRDGRGKIRAITPPDDIPPSNVALETERNNVGRARPEESQPDFGGSRDLRQKYMGCNGNTKKLGTAMSSSREPNATQYGKRRANDAARTCQSCWPPVRRAGMRMNITTARSVCGVHLRVGQGISQSADGAREGCIRSRAERTRERDDEDSPLRSTLTSKGRKRHVALLCLDYRRKRALVRR